MTKFSLGDMLIDVSFADGDVGFIIETSHWRPYEIDRDGQTLFEWCVIIKWVNDNMVYEVDKRLIMEGETFGSGEMVLSVSNLVDDIRQGFVEHYSIEGANGK